MSSTTKTKLIAHRGFSSVYLENTKPAFVLAGKEKKFDAIECDVRFSLDNIPVVFHDSNLKRLNGNKIYIAETPYLLLSKYKLFDKKYNIVDIGYSICRFEKYLKICKRYKKMCIIEIKEATKKQMDKLCDIINKFKYLDNVIFISSLQKALLYLRKKLPYVRMQLITKNPIKSKLAFCIKNKIDLSLYYRLLKKEIVERFHSFGLQVSVWTVNSLPDVVKCLSSGVDYITSDYAFDLNS